MRLCQEHRGLESAEEGTCEVAAVWLNAVHLWCAPCQMKDTIIIERDADGNWPDWALEGADCGEIADECVHYDREGNAVRVLDRLEDALTWGNQQ